MMDHLTAPMLAKQLVPLHQRMFLKYHREATTVGLKWIEDCLKYHGRELTGRHRHWCNEWDGLPIDDTCPEFNTCTCFVASTTVKRGQLVKIQG